MRVGRRFGLSDLPLFWKLLAPAVVLTLVLGIAGTFAVVRYLSNEAQSNLDADLSRTAVGADVAIADETDYLVETARVNSHVEGVQEALTGRRLDDLAQLLGGAAAVRDRADVFAFTDTTGAGLVELRRVQGGVVERRNGTGWGTASIVQTALAGAVHDVGDETAGWFRDRTTTLLLVAAPIVNDKAEPLGVAIVGTDIGNLARRTQRQVGAPTALYDSDGRLLEGSERGFAPRAPLPARNETIRKNGRIGTRAVATLYAPLQLRGGETGVAAVSLPRASIGTLSGVGVRVGAVFLAAMLLVIGIGAAIARSALRRMRNLIEAQRTLAAGELATRAHAEGRDEFGELAGGFNDMAEQLQASYRELERRVAERTVELQRLYDESVEAGKARSEFFANISHELRTPLFVIAGHAELMEHPELQPTDPGWEREYGQTIHQAALDLLERVNEILDLAKLETKKMALDLTDISLADVVNGVAAEMAPLARQARLKLHIDIPSDLPRVRADSGRLRDVVRNLLANAIKYTPTGGDVSVRAAARSARVVEVAVSDTGVGIPKDAQDLVFEPFYQVPGNQSQSQQASTGLGLALAHRLVLAHGGTMTLKSAVGEGSTFTFTLKTASSRAPRPRSTPARPRRRTASTSS